MISFFAVLLLCITSKKVFFFRLLDIILFVHTFPFVGIGKIDQFISPFVEVGTFDEPWISPGFFNLLSF